MAPEFNWSSIDVLIVEDSRTQALLLQKSLEEKQIQTRAALNGLEGLTLIKQQRPSIVISDVEMPKMNGYEFCRSIKQDPSFRTIPVILLTALSDPLDVIKGIESGADYFLTKPYRMDLLLSYIAHVLQNPHLEHVSPQESITFNFQGQPYSLKASPIQITNLLLSTYSSAMQKNQELEQANREISLAHLELKKRNEELSRLNDQKNQLLGMAAHDLRNPLGVILGYTNLLLTSLSNKVDEKALQKLNHIKKSSSFMLNLINDLLDVSVIESGKVTLELTKQNLIQLTEDNLNLNQGFAEKKQIQLVLEHDKNIPDALCDARKIEQVLNNLISNALKFSNPGTTITVRLSTNGRENLVEVKDQGVGIPKEDMSKLFQTFTKTSAKSTAGEPSTGLGLAIAKKIILEHQGRIGAESEVGKGSTFFFTLPVPTS